MDNNARQQDSKLYDPEDLPRRHATKSRASLRVFLVVLLSSACAPAVPITVPIVTPMEGLQRNQIGAVAGGFAHLGLEPVWLRVSARTEEERSGGSASDLTCTNALRQNRHLASLARAG